MVLPQPEILRRLKGPATADTPTDRDPLPTGKDLVSVYTWVLGLCEEVEEVADEGGTRVRPSTHIHSVPDRVLTQGVTRVRVWNSGVPVTQRLVPSRPHRHLPSLTTKDHLWSLPKNLLRKTRPGTSRQHQLRKIQRPYQLVTASPTFQSPK